MKKQKLANTAKVRPGDVFHLRFSPQDVVSCARVCEAANVELSNAGLARMVSFAVRTLISSARLNGVIPSDDDPFTAYQQVKQKYTFPQRAKLDAFTKLEHEDLMRENLDMPHLADEAAKRLPTGDPRAKRLKVRHEELLFKAEEDPLNMSEEDKAELASVTQQLKDLGL